MSVLAIDPHRLKSVRKARKMGRPKLAKLVGITERQLTKLETTTQDAADALPAAKLDRIAAALHIPVPVLTGELALIEEDLQPVQQTCTSGCCG